MKNDETLNMVGSSAKYVILKYLKRNITQKTQETPPYCEDIKIKGKGIVY